MKISVTADIGITPDAARTVTHMAQSEPDLIILAGRLMGLLFGTGVMVGHHNVLTAAGGSRAAFSGKTVVIECG